MSDINIFNMPLNELIEMEKKVWIKYYDLNKTIQEIEGPLSSCISESTVDMFYAGSYKYAGNTITDTSVWCPCTKVDEFYTICDYELLNGKVSNGNTNKTVIDKSSNYYNTIIKFKSYLTGNDYTIEDKKSGTKNTLLISNIYKTVEYFNEFSNKIMAKYSVYGKPNFIFTSTYRSAVNNIRGGSTVVSQHLSGMAVDVRFIGMTSNLMIRFLYDAGILTRIPGPGLTSKCYPKLDLISEKQLSRIACPTKFGVYYEPWMKDILKLNLITDTNESVRKKLEPYLTYSDEQLKDDVPINDLQLRCIRAKTINPISWMHVGFIGMDTVAPDPKYVGSGVKMSSDERNTYILFNETTKSKIKTIFENTVEQLSGDSFDRSVYYDQIMGLEE